MICNKQFPTKKIEFRNQNSPVVRAPLDEHFVSIEEKQVSSKSKKTTSNRNHRIIFDRCNLIKIILSNDQVESCLSNRMMKRKTKV